MARSCCNSKTTEDGGGQPDGSNPFEQQPQGKPASSARVEHTDGQGNWIVKTGWSVNQQNSGRRACLAALSIDCVLLNGSASCTWHYETGGKIESEVAASWTRVQDYEPPAEFVRCMTGSAIQTDVQIRSILSDVRLSDVLEIESPSIQCPVHARKPVGQPCTDIQNYLHRH